MTSLNDYVMLNCHNVLTTYVAVGYNQALIAVE